jgi:hypothetical protein
MDSPSAWYQVCACGQTFGMIQAYSNHKCSCQKTKKWLASALDQAKEVWAANKQRKMEEKITTQVGDGASNGDAAHEGTCNGDVGIAPAVCAEVQFNTSCMHSILRTISFPVNCRYGA